MTEYGLFLEDISGNVQFPMDVFSEVAQPKTRKVTIYHSSDSFDPKTIEEEIGPVQFGFRGLLQADIVERERKLHYLVRTGNDILLVYFDRDVATYASISTAKLQNDPGSNFDIFSVSLTAKGAVLGQVREAVDSRCTTTGSEITDTDALLDEAVYLGAANEYVFFTQTQNEYMLLQGDYDMLARLKKSADASDNIATMQVYNVTDASEVASCTKTLDTDYETYICAFTIDALDNDDSIRFRVLKEDVSGNVNVDFMAFAASP